jgi:hypothetical protein
MPGLAQGCFLQSALGDLTLGLMRSVAASTPRPA